MSHNQREQSNTAAFIQVLRVFDTMFFLVFAFG
jgi:hypothetical protein